MKKKLGLLILILLEAAILIGVYLIGGVVAPYLWIVAVFVLAPAAVVGLLAELVIFILRACKKKGLKWNFVFLLVTIIFACPITVLFGVSPLVYPVHQSDAPTIEIIDPIEGGVIMGGKEYKSHAYWPGERYAYDILKQPYDTKAANLEDYGVYLADVRCPISGTILACSDSEADIPPNTEEADSFLGNYIFMEVEATGTYLILAHLEQDSIVVSPGDKVEQGDILAKVGNSGMTSEPHLHLQHQKNDPTKLKIFLCAQGLPMQVKE